MTNVEAHSEASAEANKWVSAYSALRQFEALYLDRVAAKSTLADCLRDGELQARADFVIESRDPKIGDARRRAKEGDWDEENLIIRAYGWRLSKDWRNDQERWRWPLDEFLITESKSPLLYRLYEGVRFLQSDLDIIFRKRVASSGGAPRKDVEWTTFWHAVIKLSQEGRLKVETFPTIASLRTELLIMISDALSEASIKPTTSQIYKKFVAPDATE
jgi:hypothetical protein